MLDVDTFLTTLYVTVDDLRQSHPTKRRPGPDASLSESEEVVTLAIFARWSRFAGERDFYRYYAERDTSRGGIPDPARALSVQPAGAPLRGTHRGGGLAPGGGDGGPAISLRGPGDSSAMPVRDAKRRGAGWLAGYADIGWSNSLGWYEGFRRLLAAVAPSGVITGFCFSAASTADQQAAETFFAVRARPNPRLSSVGSASSGPYVTDKGFEGADNHRRWLDRVLRRTAYLPA